MSVIVGRKPIGTISYMGGVMAVPEDFAWSWGQMLAYNSEIWLGEKPAEFIHYTRAKASDHAPSRNMLAATMQGEWLIQFDTDHTFDCDIAHRLVRLADEAGVDVVSGMYQFKHPPNSPVAFYYDQTGASKPIAAWDRKARLLEIGATGAGCLFVRKSVFQKIARECPDQPFTRFVGWSEDHSFFRRCHEVGIKTYLAPQIECNHLRVHAISLDDYDMDAQSTDATYSVGGYC